MSRCRGAALSRTLWSTTEVAVSDAYEYWVGAICETLVQVAGRATGDAPFHGRIDHATPGGIGLATVAAGPQEVVRTDRLIARDQEALLLVNVQTCGQSVVQQDGRSAALSPGMMTFLDTTRPYTLEFSRAFSHLVVGIPQAFMPGRSLAGVTALELDGHGPGPLVAEFLVGLDRQQRDDPAIAAALLPNAVSLLESVLDWVDRGRASETSAVLARERIHRFVRQHIHDSSLDAARVAAGCGLSRRSLFRALSADGESLTQLIRRLRVDRARHLLHARPDMPLAAVAAQSGFGGASQMHRAFHSVVGMTPGDYWLFAVEGSAGRRVVAG
jgi:AraC-like DNA-binding protein